jgi:hypothetical protein
VYSALFVFAADSKQGGFVFANFLERHISYACALEIGIVKPFQHVLALGCHLVIVVAPRIKRPVFPPCRIDLDLDIRHVLKKNGSARYFEMSDWKRCRILQFPGECQKAIQGATRYSELRSKRLLGEQAELYILPFVPVRDVVGLIAEYLVVSVLADFEAYFCCYLRFMGVYKIRELAEPLFDALYEYNESTRRWLLAHNGIRDKARMARCFHAFDRRPCARPLDGCLEPALHARQWNIMPEIWRRISTDFL